MVGAFALRHDDPMEHEPTSPEQEGPEAEHAIQDSTSTDTLTEHTLTEDTSQDARAQPAGESTADEAPSASDGEDVATGSQTNGRKWVRRTEGRVLAGVTTGLAHTLDIPVWLVRVAFVATALANGFGVLAYIAAWGLMPQAGEHESYFDEARRSLEGADRPGRTIGLVLIAIGALIVVGNTGLLSSPVFVAVALAVAGIALIKND
jgi:phage shock protein PspC (stress-responsive transcriptional regulator)